MCLIRTIGASGMTTARASLAGLAGINPHDRDPRPFCFVDNHIIQLTESPVVHHAVEPFASPYPAADTIQLLEDDHAAGCICYDIDQFATDFVVYVSLPIPLFALAGPYPVQPALALHPGTVSLETTPSILNDLARPELDDIWPNQRCYLRDPQVHTEELNTITDGRYVSGIADGQLDVPFVIALEDTGITLSEGKSVQIPPWDTEREPNVCAPLACGDTQNPTVTTTKQAVGMTAETDRKVSINSGPRRFPEMSRFLQAPIGMYHALGLAQCHSRIIGRKVKSFTNDVVATVMQSRKAGRTSILVREIQDIIHGLVVSFLYRLEVFSLVISGRDNLDYNTFFPHSNYSITQLRENVKFRVRRSGFLSAAEIL